ncbi:MAG: tRNA-dihydrouridine synthase family protein [Planctomycetes bacterium]|nr:tRNA-dihydrouridine synthase family protein [Planctomycetota bacterium]
MTELARVQSVPALDLGGGVVFDPPFVLAPMEGVTHRVFRDLILDLGGAGGAWTEFLRVSQQALKPKHVRRDLGPPRPDVPVGVQLMGTQPELVALSAQAAVRAGAPTIDLNFGCPAPRVFNKCAGSGMLREPARVEAMIAACVAAVDVPVTAKIRLGIDDCAQVDELIGAVNAAGPAALTVHARTVRDGYKHPARWDELSRVRALTPLPLIGNGDVVTPADAERMLTECDVDGVMIGRGMLRDPWLLARLAALRAGAPEPVVDRAALLRFHARYRDDMLAARGDPRGVLGQLKQLYRRLDVGVPISPELRTSLLRSPSIDALESTLFGEPVRSADTAPAGL